MLSVNFLQCTIYWLIYSCQTPRVSVGFIFVFNIIAQSYNEIEIYKNKDKLSRETKTNKKRAGQTKIITIRTKQKDEPN